MIATIDRIARAAGYAPGEDYTLEELVERVTFLRAFAEAAYRRGSSHAPDFEAAARGVAASVVGRLLSELNRDMTRFATTEPGTHPDLAEEVPRGALRWPSNLPKEP